MVSEMEALEMWDFLRSQRTAVRVDSADLDRLWYSSLYSVHVDIPRPYRTEEVLGLSKKLRSKLNLAQFFSLLNLHPTWLFMHVGPMTPNVLFGGS